ISSEQQGTAIAQGCAYRTQEGRSIRPIEVADVRSEKQDQRPFGARVFYLDVSKTDVVGNLVTDDDDVVEHRESARRRSKRAGRDVDEVQRQFLSGTPATALDEASKLVAVSGSEFRDGRHTVKVREHLRAVCCEQTAFRSCHPIPGQLTDGVKERRAKPVVQIA